MNAPINVKTAHEIVHLSARLAKLDALKAEAEKIAACPELSIKYVVVLHRPGGSGYLKEHALPVDMIDPKFLAETYLRHIERQRVSAIADLQARGVRP